MRKRLMSEKRHICQLCLSRWEIRVNARHRWWRPVHHGSTRNNTEYLL